MNVSWFKENNSHRGTGDVGEDLDLMDLEGFWWRVAWGEELGGEAVGGVKVVWWERNPS